MKALWSLSLDDYVEILKRAEKAGVKTGESIEKYLFQYTKEKGQKPIGNTELNNEELLKEYASHGKKGISMETKNGKTTFKGIKKDE